MSAARITGLAACLGGAVYSLLMSHGATPAQDEETHGVARVIGLEEAQSGVWVAAPAREEQAGLRRA